MEVVSEIENEKKIKKIFSNILRQPLLIATFLT